MDLDHMKTVEILAAKAATWGLPEATNEAEAHSDDEEDFDLISTSLENIKKREKELAELLFPPEITAIRANMKRYRVLQKQIDISRETMKELRDSYESVSSRTCSLHDACDRALAEQTSLSTGSQLIKTNLYYFKQADAIMKKLSVAKLMVTGHSFAAILVSIDECLTYLRAHPEYKESEAYIAKFEQCLSRAMTWVRVAVLADLDACFNDVKDRQAQLEADYEKIGRGGQDEDTFALLYGVFASKAAVVNSEHLSMWWNNDSQRYRNSRKCSRSVSMHILQRDISCSARFSSQHSQAYPRKFQYMCFLMFKFFRTHAESTCRLTRDACTFMLRTCDDEYRLYRQFFVTHNNNDDRKMSTDGRISPAMSTITSVFTSQQTQQQVHPFETFAEQMCRTLYDMLRPRIVHNPHLETLAELCTMIKVEMIENRCSLQMVASILGDDANQDPNVSGLNPRAGFVAVMSELVGDIAERIVHRAGLYAQNDIGAYRPASGDIAYPQMLQMIRKIESEQKEQKEKEEGVESTTTTTIDQHCLWYPTVRRTVMCLSKIFPCLDIGVFHSLARDMLFACIESLQTASDAILATPAPAKGWSKKLDAHLFVVKHLLILREQTAPYRQNVLSSRSDALNTKDFSIDFSKFTNVLFDSNSKWFELSTNNTLLELITTVPIEMREHEGDSRRVLDQQLRVATFRLAHEASQLMIGALAEWIDLAEDERLQEGFELSKHPKLAAGVLKDLASQAYRNVGSKFVEIRDAYTLYIGVAETEAILLSPVRKRVIDVFTRVNSFASKTYDEESRAVAALPNVQQLVLMLNK
ncbi:CRE-COGC-3 protein [Caenorhabditis remanei]|uniref:Conserved oligomeric Golgi complex subunit 3 n=1 Tax=Caenorhabditis remanei TaxID=31234 RepID=E3N4T2_CAERE|nr:CRE-COGC-3 protein [Caenorhabditis remanei]